MNYLQTYQKHLGVTPDGIIGKNTAKVMMEDLGIKSIVEFCHFLAQIKHESSNFTAGRENLNYSAAALIKYFSKYFTAREAAAYARQPIRIANRIYGNRMGNGPERSGDGFKYRGTAAIQLTGKTNIQGYFESVQLPLDTDPNVILQPEHYFKSAVWFFNENDVWQYCDNQSKECIVKTSKKINLGNADSPRTPIGLPERIQITNRLFTILC